MTQDINKLKQYAGAPVSSSRTKLEVPIISLGGTTGDVTLMGLDKSKTIIKLPFECTILRIRRQAWAFRKEDGKNISQYSTEHDTWKDHITVFEYKDSKNKVIAEGTYNEIYATMPELKMKNNAYVLYEGNVCKLEIKGSSRRAFVDFQKELNSDGKETFEKNIKIDVAEQTGGAFKYFSMTFEKAGDSDMDKVAEKLGEIGPTFEKMNAEYGERVEKNRKEHSPVDVSTEQAGFNEETIDAETPTNSDGEDSQDKKVEKIPF